MIPHRDNHYISNPYAHICPKHNEPIQGICIYFGKCDSRLLCRKCRKSHTNIHPPQLNHYEELDDLISGRIIRELSQELNTIIEKITAQNKELERSNTALIEQINLVYRRASENILKKMEDSKLKLVEEVLRTTKSNKQILDRICAGTSTMGEAISTAMKSHYQGNTLEYLVKTFCFNMSLKTAIENDPVMFRTEEYTSKIHHLTNVQMENIFHSLNLSLEKMDQDVVGGFIKEFRDISNFTPANSNIFRRIENGEEPINPSREEEKHNLQPEPQHASTNNQNYNANQNPPQSFNQNQFAYNIPQNQQSSISPNTSQNPISNSIFRPSTIQAPQESNVRLLFDKILTNEAGNTSPLLNADYEFLRPIQPMQTLTPPVYTNNARGERTFAREDDDERSDINQEPPRSISPHYQPNQMNPNRSFESHRRLFEDISPNARTNEDENSSINQPLNIYNTDMPRYMGKTSPFDAMRIGNHRDNTKEPGLTKKRFPSAGEPYRAGNPFDTIKQLYEKPQYNPAYLNNQSGIPSKTAKRRQKKKERMEKRMRQNTEGSPARNQDEKTTSTHKILQLFRHVNENDTSRSPMNRTEKIKRVTIDAQVKEEEDEDTIEAINQTNLTEDQLFESIQAPKKKNTTFHFDHSYKTNQIGVKASSMIYLPSYKHIVTGGEEGKVFIYSTESKKKIAEFSAHQGPINYLYYLAEKEVLITAGDNSISVWDYDNGFKCLGSFLQHIGRVFAFEYLSNINLMISGGEEDSLRLWNLENFKQLNTMKIKGKKVFSLCFMENHHSLAIGFDSGTINIIHIEPQSRKALYTIYGHRDKVVQLKYHQHSSILFSCGDFEIKAFKIRVEGYQPLLTFKAPGSLIQSFDFSSEKNLMVASSTGHKIHVWKLGNAQTVHSSYEPKLGEPIVFLKDGRNFGSFWNGEVQVWKLN